MQPIDFPPVPEANVERPGCLHYLLFAAAAAWAMVVVALVQGGTWFYDQYAQTQGESVSSVYWMLAALGQAVLLALPIVPLAWFTRTKPLRAAYVAWALAIGLGLLFSLPRLFPATWTQSAALAQIVLSLLAAFVLSRLGKDSSPRSQFSMFNSQFLFALALGLLVALPWLHYGALGSPLDTVLNLLAGFGLGFVAAQLLSRFL
ncbi:MAG TPA: hypothetical protein VFX76_03760, partial [Roseiflexaceae bacterium]|nr:hypothetical protein [Roseiflexaceae bacterium]